MLKQGMRFGIAIAFLSIAMFACQFNSEGLTRPATDCENADADADGVGADCLGAAWNGWGHVYEVQAFG